ncbi:hypothetical protein UY3_11434 [Chelonia mydas]|uniref:Uncharacterized protein n=1 Tax=Chelonia mydas TaxID=8469 RepID=M7B7J2_CHEMY|nr:hypothetical protein UY3_11434 [Chelonia mydas]
MTERDHDRDTLQCRVKVKELWNVYHKAQEANRRSGAAPTSCRFYKELDTILSGNPTSTADTSVARVPVKSGQAFLEAEILDEEGEGDQEAEDDSEQQKKRCSVGLLPRVHHSEYRCKCQKCEHAIVQAADSVNTQQRFPFSAL